ncbi:efflux RND transporter periplasmic adaptor subunit [Lichenicoccus sp.]|uniref:efflux RND transporter periplasmic adaptor subunit n=1 Tax=Lichenicoccus sp. TaxID=2781899 RepID=UPI003D0C9AFB
MRHLLVLAAWLLLSTPALAAPSVLVQTQPPHRGALPRLLDTYGTIQAAPGGGSETISLPRPSEVTALSVYAGEPVHAGQMLLALRADPASVAAYQQAVAALTQARGNHTRATEMLREHLGTRDQLALAVQAQQDAQANLDAIERSGGGAPEQTVSAAFDGVVSAVLVAQGARVAANTPLLTVVRSAGLVAAVGIEPGQSDKVAVGQPATIVPLYGDATAQGRVGSVGGLLDPRTRLVPAMIAPPPGASMTPGTPVRVAITTGSMDGWLVPRDAVSTDAHGPHVFVVGAGKAHRVEVKIVGHAGDTTVVSGTLDMATPLVTSGNTQLHDGEDVRTDSSGSQ